MILSGKSATFCDIRSRNYALEQDPLELRTKAFPSSMTFSEKPATFRTMP